MKFQEIFLRTGTCSSVYRWWWKSCCEKFCGYFSDLNMAILHQCSTQAVGIARHPDLLSSSRDLCRWLKSTASDYCKYEGTPFAIHGHHTVMNLFGSGTFSAKNWLHFNALLVISIIVWCSKLLHYEKPTRSNSWKQLRIIRMQLRI